MTSEPEQPPESLWEFDIDVRLRRKTWVYAPNEEVARSVVLRRLATTAWLSEGEDSQIVAVREVPSSDPEPA